MTDNQPQPHFFAGANVVILALHGADGPGLFANGRIDRHIVAMPIADLRRHLVEQRGPLFGASRLCQPDDRSY